MNKLSDPQIHMLRLIGRSAQHKDNWIKVSRTTWPAIIQLTVPELVELNHDTEQVKLTEEGQILTKWL